MKSLTFKYRFNKTSDKMLSWFIKSARFCDLSPKDPKVFFFYKPHLPPVHMGLLACACTLPLTQ